MIIRQCNQCCQEYEAEARYINRGQGLFCGRDCAVKFNSRKRKEQSILNVSCSLCQSPLHRKAGALKRNKLGLFFCSIEHSHQYYSAHPGIKGKFEPKICPGCGKGGLRNTWCSMSCKNTNNNSLFIQAWLDGEESGVTSGGGINARIRKYLIEKAGNQCSRCGWAEVNETTGNVPLTIDHINGKWWENNPENLKVLCPNCHSLTPTYGSLNKGNGRPSRRKKV